MDRIVKDHLSVIVGVSVLGLATGFFALRFIHGAASTMSANAFALWIFIVPCVIMFVCSFAIAATAREIGRQLYLVVIGINLACGVVTMIVTSGWLSDSATVALLMANSDPDTVIVPILKSPVTILRDIAAFVVIPTVGLIVGAWTGSRLHPLRGEKQPKKSKGKR